MDITKNSLDQYIILGSYNLDDLAVEPSSSLYKFLRPLKKDTFADNERIVFYIRHPISDEIISHLRKTLIYLDIPEFFVLIITNQANIEDSLNGFDSRIIEYKPLFNDDNRMCAHAWAGIHLWPDGTASPCCESHQKITKSTGELYNINENTIEEILDSPWMQNLRQQFREGKQSSNCDSCWQRESLGQDSRRTISPYKLENIYGNIDWEQEGQLMYLGGHLGNLCNLKCRICDSKFSSSIANEHISILPLEERKTSEHYLRSKHAEWIFDDKFWGQLRARADTIKNFEFLGGEPFMLKQNSEFVQYLIDHNIGQDTVFYFSTNGTQYPEILDQANRLKRLEITFSIDNINQRYQLERDGADWNQVVSNLHRFIQLKEKIQNLKIDICVTVNIQNVLYLPEIISWINSLNIDSHYLNYVEDPKYMSIKYMTAEAKNLVRDQLAGFFPDIVQIIEDSPGSDGKEFCAEMQRLDQLRNQNFANTHTDIAKAMGYR